MKTDISSLLLLLLLLIIVVDIIGLMIKSLEGILSVDN